ncbi:MAG TPA: hypothetical protein VF307_04080 [Candidatus Nanopelagicaceae bacterium]
MNKRHLAVAVVAVLALSSSTIASAEGGSHRRMSDFEHITSVAPIGLSNSPIILTIDTSTAEPRFHFDTSTAVAHIDFDRTTATTHFDDEAGITDDGVGQDDFLPGNSPIFPPSNLSTPPSGLTPNAPVTPPVPSWIKKPQAKSNDENRSQSRQSSEDSHD